MSNDGRRDPRSPLALKIRFKSATLNDFVEKHSRDLSRGGIFIKMATPLPVGTLIKFDVRIEDEQSLIQGVGRVVWRREAAREDSPAGMGIKFIKLDTTSRENLDTLLEGRSDSGPPGEAPTVEQVVSIPSRPPQPISPVRPVNVPKDAKRTMMGVGVSSQFKTPGTGETSSSAQQPATSLDSQPPRDFLADISDAIGDALASPTAVPPERKAPERDIFDEGPTRVATPGMVPADAYDRVIIDSQSTTRDDQTPTGLQPVDTGVADGAVGDWNEEGSDEYDRTVARPLLSEDIARKAEELETTPPKAAPAVPPKATPAKAVVAPASDAGKATAPRAAEPAPHKADNEPLALGRGEPAAPDRPTLPSPQAPAKKGGLGLLAAGAVFLAGLAGLGYWYFTLGPGTAPLPEPVVTTPAPEPPAPPPTPAPEPIPTVDTTPTKAVSFALIEVTSEPVGAEIFVAGASKGKTPATVEGVETGVEVEITAKLFGYKTATIKTKPAEDGAKAAIKLEPAVVQVVLESDPPEARVKLADDWIGKTPRTTKLKGKGPDVSYLLEKQGYETLTGAIGAADWTEADGVFTATVKVTLTKIATAPTPAPVAAPDKAETHRPKKPAAEVKKPVVEEKKPAAEVKKPADEKPAASRTVDENPF